MQNKQGYTMQNNQQQDTEMHRIDILKLFGPRIAKAKVPDRMLKALNDNCNSIIKSKKKRKEYDSSDFLVGHVSEELTCKQDLPELNEFFRYLGQLTKCLIDETLKERTPAVYGDAQLPEQVDLQVESAWYIRSFKGDYNPVHLHSSGDFSCVLYLEVPDSIGTENTRNKKEIYTTEGYIDFIYGMTTTLCSGNQVFMPVVGEIYVFPAFLYHTVYPFFGKGERRSFSANFSVKAPEYVNVVRK